MMQEPGDQAQDFDAWLRIVCNEDHFNRAANHVHHAFFKGKTAITKPEQPRNWHSECSGRLKSLAHDVLDDGCRRAERMRLSQIKNGSDGRKAKFIGIIIREVSSIRCFPSAKTDVIYDPISDGEFKDPAHANLVFYDKLPDEARQLTFINELIKLFEFVDPANIPLRFDSAGL